MEANQQEQQDQPTTKRECEREIQLWRERVTTLQVRGHALQVEAALIQYQGREAQQNIKSLTELHAKLAAAEGAQEVGGAKPPLSVVKE